MKTGLGVFATVPLEKRVLRVQELDLEPIKFKLVHDSDGESWTVDRVDRVERDYKRFLELVLRNLLSGRLESIVPSKEVDEFWHAHILDTAKYMGDCEYCFGFYLHHFPYLGLRGAEDAQKLKKHFQSTREYYREVFGEQCISEGSSVCTSCGTADCAPTPSCEGGSPPTRAQVRPVLAR